MKMDYWALKAQVPSTMRAIAIVVSTPANASLQMLSLFNWYGFKIAFDGKGPWLSFTTSYRKFF